MFQPKYFDQGLWQRFLEETRSSRFAREVENTIDFDTFREYFRVSLCVTFYFSYFLIYDCKFCTTHYLGDVFKIYLSPFTTSMFNHLQVHTHYSLLEAIGAPKAYIEQAKKLGMQALACTDYGGMYGAVEFYQAAKKAGIKPIIGTELGYVADMSHKDPQEAAGTILLLARTYAGYEQLMKLVSAAHLTGFHKIPRIDHACLAAHATDLIAIVGGDRSRLGKSLLQKHDDALILDQRQQLTTTLGSDYCFLSRIAQEKPTGSLHTCNELVHHFGVTQNCKTIVSGDVHYIHAHDQQIFETALAIKDGKRIYDTERRLATHQMHLQSEDEITQWLGKTALSGVQITTLIETTQLIVDSIDLQIPMDTILFPIYESPEHITSSYVTRKNDLIVK